MLNIKVNPMDSIFIKRRKKSVQTKFKATQSRTIEEASELSVYIYSLGNELEAEELLNSFSEESPYNEHRPQRWAAVGEAILFNAYIKKLNGEMGECERLKKIIVTHDYDPIPGGKDKYLPRLKESLNSGIEMWDSVTKHEKCQIIAQSFLLCVYAKLMFPSLCEKYELESGFNISSEMVSLLERLKNEVSN